MTEREARRRAQQSASDRETNDALSAAERRAYSGSLSINEWCSLRRVSRSMFYKLEGQGLALDDAAAAGNKALQVKPIWQHTARGR